MPEEVTGAAVVLDGDSLRVANVEVRLHGLDAPEMDQPCWNAAGERYPCGARVTQALGRTLMGRNVHDIGQMLVRAGGAVAYTRYSEDYVADEVLARGRLRGIWSGHLDPPEPWRHLEEGKRAGRIQEVEDMLERFGERGPAMVPPLRTRYP